jgi:NCS1 family nucleobase:cation symporter-1
LTGLDPGSIEDIVVSLAVLNPTCHRRYAFAAFFLVLNAYPGAVHHLIFPAYIRTSFGPIGALWPVFNRAAMACVWYGVQAWIGGQCVYVLLVAMFPSTANIPNGIPNSGTDTGHFLGFFLFSAPSIRQVSHVYCRLELTQLFVSRSVISSLSRQSYHLLLVSPCSLGTLLVYSILR